MAFTGKEIQEFFANFGTCKVQFNRHLILLYAVGARFLVSSMSVPDSSNLKKQDGMMKSCLDVLRVSIFFNLR